MFREGDFCVDTFICCLQGYKLKGCGKTLYYLLYGSL